MTKQMPDGDYELADGKAWFVVKNFSIRIRETENGVSIGAYKNGREADGPVHSAHVFDNEVNEPVKENQMKEHPHAWALRMIADGVPVEEFEVKYTSLIWGWVCASRYAWFANPEKWQVRRKQKMHRIGEHTFPAPMTEAPKSDTCFWTVYISFVAEGWWVGASEDWQSLREGRVHVTKEAAEAHSKALAAIARGEPV